MANRHPHPLRDDRGRFTPNSPIHAAALPDVADPNAAAMRGVAANEGRAEEEKKEAEKDDDERKQRIKLYDRRIKWAGALWLFTTGLANKTIPEGESSNTATLLYFSTTISMAIVLHAMIMTTELLSSQLPPNNTWDNFRLTAYPWIMMFAVACFLTIWGSPFAS